MVTPLVYFYFSFNPHIRRSTSNRHSNCCIFKFLSIIFNFNSRCYYIARPHFRACHNIIFTCRTRLCPRKRKRGRCIKSSISILLNKEVIIIIISTWAYKGKAYSSPVTTAFVLYSCNELKRSSRRYSVVKARLVYTRTILSFERETALCIHRSCIDRDILISTRSVGK